jgi:hypothetical protein
MGRRSCATRVKKSRPGCAGVAHPAWPGFFGQSRGMAAANTGDRLKGHWSRRCAAASVVAEISAGCPRFSRRAVWLRESARRWNQHWSEIKTKCQTQYAECRIQDSSSVNYATLRHTKGLGKLNDSDALGLHFHTTIAVQTDGVIRGLLHQSHWSRPPDAEPVAAQHQGKSIAAKESYKWLEGIEAAEAALDGLPADQRPRLLHIFDREGDIHEVLQRITDSPHGAVIRVAQKKRGVDGPLGNVGDTIASAPCLGVHIIDVPPQHGSKKRQARLQNC